MTRQLPAHLDVRYDYHEHPAGVSAVVFDDHATIQAVGYAKFNQRDSHFDYALGERIALGRALAKLDEYGSARRAFRPPRIVRGRDQGARGLLRTLDELEPIDSFKDEVTDAFLRRPVRHDPRLDEPTYRDSGKADPVIDFNSPAGFNPNGS